MNPTTPESPLLRRLGAMRTVAPLAKAGPFLFQACEPRIAISRGYGLAWVMLDDEQYRNAATIMLLKEYPKRQAVHLPVETVVVMDRTTRQRGFVYVDLTEPDLARPDGLCECGCGEKTKIARKTKTECGHIKGQPLRFVHGHNNQGLRGPETSQWKGGRTINSEGYAKVIVHEHPRAHATRYVLHHIVIAEQVLGRYISAPIEVHHVNGIKSDNRNRNLVICENRAYHRLLHKRAMAYHATGNPRSLKCFICKQWDAEMHMDERGSWHRECATRKTTNWKLAKSSQQGGASCSL